MHPNLRPDQQNIIEQASELVRTSTKPILNINTFTGSGITILTFGLVEMLPIDGVRLVVVQGTDIVVQTLNLFCVQGCISHPTDKGWLLTPNGHVVYVLTKIHLSINRGRFRSTEPLWDTGIIISLNSGFSAEYIVATMESFSAKKYISLNGRESESTDTITMG